MILLVLKYMCLVHLVLSSSAVSPIGLSAYDILVKSVSVGSYECTLEFLGRSYKCSLGMNGVNTNKLEGDGTTPIGAFPLRQAFYRVTVPKLAAKTGHNLTQICHKLNFNLSKFNPRLIELDII
jgi:L,D-peptidoglycan transpeptidase YkuD (ErfK/YbiS/YcfS/YnhG family)